jgi:hypothetical protein
MVMAFTFLFNVLGYSGYMFFNSVASSKYVSVNVHFIVTLSTTAVNSMSQYMQKFLQYIFLG